MGKIEKVSIAVTTELAETAREAVRRGDYASFSEVMREALRDWSLKREDRAVAIARIRQLWDEGLASGPPADREPLETFKLRVRERLSKIRAA